MSPSEKTIVAIIRYAAWQDQYLKPTETLSLRLVYVNTTNG